MVSSFYSSNLLLLLVILPIISSFIILLLPAKNGNLIRYIGTFTSFFVFFMSLLLWLFFDNNYVRFQFIFNST